MFFLANINLLREKQALRNINVRRIRGYWFESEHTKKCKIKIKCLIFPTTADKFSKIQIQILSTQKVI